MNRSKQNCGNCSAFVAVGDGPVGSCCANAPVVMQGLQKSVAHGGAGVPVLQGVFPPTRMDAWCRQWQSAVDFQIDNIRGN